MTIPPIPATEKARRLEALRALEVLDTAPEPVFESMTALAARTCGVPIALISLIDAERQWFKSNHGLAGVVETHRCMAFCDHAIRTDSLLEINDAALDLRFADNPLVTGDPGIRFYAGMPIVLPGGERIGTLCVIDRQPSRLDASQRVLLEGLARLAAIYLIERMQLIETRSALDVQEKRYRAIVDDQAELISLCEPDGTLTLVNPAYARHFGLVPTQVIGRNLIEFVQPEDRVAVTAHLAQICATRIAAIGVNRHPTHDSGLRWVAWNNRPILDVRGHVTGIQSVGRDITEQHLAEQALAQSEARYRRLYEATPAILQSVDVDGRLLTVSDRWLRSFGYERGEVIGKRPVDFMTPASAQRARDEVDPEFGATGRVDNVEYQFVHKSGRTVDVLFSATSEWEGESSSRRTLAVLDDISDRKAIAAELSRAHAHIDTILDNLPALVSYLDGEQRFQFANKAYEEWFGIERGALLGKTLLEFYGPQVHPLIEPHFRAAFAGRTVTYERPAVGLGSRDYVHVTMVPHRDEHGTVIGIYTLIHDISARRAAEQRSAASERFVRHVTDSLPAMVAYVDRDETYRFANAHFRPTMGVAPEKVIGQTMAEFLGAAAHRELEPHIKAALAGERRRFERTGWKNNANIHFLVDYVPEIGASGQVDGFIILVFDISERRNSELALAHSEKRLRAITDNLPAMISHIDRDLRFTFANAKVGETLDCNSAALIGRYVRDVHSDITFREMESPMHRALSGETVSVEIHRTARDGTQQQFDANYVPEIDASGQVLGFYALTFEVSERKQAEARLLASEKMLDRTGSIGGVGGWQLELATSALHWTSQTRRIHEVDADYIPDVMHAIDFYRADVRPQIQQALETGLATGSSWDMVLPIVTAKGRETWVRATGEVEFEDGKPVRLMGAFQDVNQRVAFEQQLREQAELLQVTLTSIGDGVITTDADGRVRWMNPVAQRMTGWTNAEAAGRSSAQVFHVIHAESRAVAPDPIEVCLRTLGAAGLPSRSVLISADGQEYAVEDAASPIRDEAGRLRGAVLVFHDVSEQRRMSDQMTYRATHDELTGLINRVEFEARVERVLTKSRDDGSVSAMMFIDLDQFKLVNDACGHAMGDKLLCQVSVLMSQCVRNRDTLARLGGDEFGVLLEHCNVEQAQRVAQGICDRMDEFRFIHDGRKFRIGASIGLVPIDARWRSQAPLRQAADTACYAAKEAGRNRVHVWFDTDQVLRSREGETQWGSRLESALDEHSFVLYAQRIESVRPVSEGLHFEVLIRLREADGTIVAPGRFLPAAERFHMASRIDRWVLREVFQWLRDDGGSPDIDTVSVNLSGQSIGDRAFHRFVVQLMEELPIDPRKLCFEVTETAAITNLADATAFIRSMRHLGMRVALDDFGAGASSFGYLKNLPVDYLKIDGQFIRNIQNDPLDLAAVRCFQEVAKAIGVKTVAEFVETTEVMDMIREIGIDFAQGYLLHKPEPLQSMLARVRGEVKIAGN